MKTSCKTLASVLAGLVLTAELSSAAVPTEWNVRIGPKATVYQAERYHGDALDLRATLTSGGLPLVYQGSARLYAQTNGMGALWWDLAPVTVASNVLAATWRPEFDTGADVVDVFLGAPSNFQAHARIRFLPSPGPAPNSLPMPTPVLDFSAVELRNISALTNGWSFGDSGGPYLSATGGVVSGTVKVEGKVGASADNGDAELGRDGVRVRRAGFPSSQVLKVKWPSAGNGTFARLEDIPAAPDLTDATNYTDQVAAEFANGTRTVKFAVSAQYAEESAQTQKVLNSSGNESYDATDLIRESTNAAIAVAARKQDALPYPTNAIPYAAIDGAPSGGAPEWRGVQIDENTPVSFVTNGIAAKLINGELYATTNGWPDGASMFVRGSVEMPQYDVGEEIRLVGYGTWPTNNFQSVWWRSGTNIFVNILVEE